MEVTKYPLALLDIRGLTGWFALGGIYKRSGKASGSVGESFKNPNIYVLKIRETLTIKENEIL